MALPNTTTRLVSYEYEKLRLKKVEEYTEKFNHAVRNRKIYEKLILDNEKYVEPNEIINYINDVTIHKTKQYNKFKIKELYKSYKFNEVNEDSRDFDIIKLKINNFILSEDSDKHRLIFSYYYNFMRYVILESDLDLQIEKYENLKLSNNMLVYLFKTYFWCVSNELLLSGEKYELPYNVTIKVVGKNKNYSRKKYKTKYEKVDWGKSLKTLKSIAKDIDIDLYNSYINKSISKSLFIEQMKKYTYNKDTNIKGKKWLVKSTSDYNLWLVIWSKYSILKNISNYSIIPTNFIINETKSQIDFTNNVKNIKEIISSKLLGFRDKLRALERFDLNYCLNKFENNHDI